MVRTRKSLADLQRDVDEADRAERASRNAVAPMVPAKRPRGYQSTAPLAASSRDSPSSIAVSANSSASEYSTPMTSHVPTPAPSFLADGSGRITRSTRANNIEVIIPSAKNRASDSAVRRGMAMEKANRNLLNPRRQSRALVMDNGDDDLYNDSPSAERTRHDQDLARQLQDQFDLEAAAALVVDDNEQDEDELHDADESDTPMTTCKAKGKAVIRRRTRASRATNDSYFVVEPQGELINTPFPEDTFDSDAQPAKKQKTMVKGRGKPLSTKESAQSINASRNDTAPAKRRPGRPKKVVEPTPQSLSLPSTPGPDNVSSAGWTDDSEIMGSSSRDDNDDITTYREFRRAYNARRRARARARKEGKPLEEYHPELDTMWGDLENMPILKAGKAEQPKSISRPLKPFQLEGLKWMTAMEKTQWKGGLLGDEMGLGKTIQAVSLIMSDWPAKRPSLVLVPPVALMQWVTEIDTYTDGTLKTLVYHGTNSKSKGITLKDLKKYDVIIMSYNSLESAYRKQEKGFSRKDGVHKERSIIHATHFHRAILDEAHYIKTRTTMTAKACFALKVEYRWCLSGTPLQNRIGELFSILRFLEIRPFASYMCRQCPCSMLEWAMTDDRVCKECDHSAMSHISVFNREVLNPIQNYGNLGPGQEAFQKLKILTDRFMLRRLKKDHTNSMELPVKEIYVDRQLFGEEEHDFANSIMTNSRREFHTYVAQGVLLNNYANIFGLIMQMRQVADHPDLLLRKSGQGGQNVLVCCICDEPAEDAIRSRCKHDFCRECAKSYLNSQDQPDCPQCHINLSIDLEQPKIEQDEAMVKKSSIINRIKMENWTSSTKIELLVHELHKLRSDNASHKSIIFSQFTTMLQLIEWRLRRAGITTVMLNGSMTPAQRAASIDYFMKNVDVEVFLVSLKAGGVALNLTEASRVFIVDPWWNPAAEWQSADRCHRIGQTRPCTITRLCIEDSVESRMVLLQEKKTNMINSTIDNDEAASASLSPEDLQFLFRSN